MKITGNSKIKITEAQAESVIVEPIKTLEKEMRETLIVNAESADLMQNNGKISIVKDKVKQAKQIAKEAFDKTKPLRDKQKVFAAEAIQKAKSLHPYVDKTITAIDVAIEYIANPNANRREVVQETRPPALFGVWVMIITFGVGMVWSMVAPLDSASHAIGKIVLESKRRVIQHPYGGTIKEVLVRDGDHVTKGQVLATLEDAELAARKKNVEYRYFALLAESARLSAEKDDLDEIKFPEELLEYKDDTQVQEMLNNQNKFFIARKNNFDSSVALTEKKIAQAIEQRNALLPQLEASEKLVKITSDQVETYKKLHAKGNVNKLYLQDAETRKADALGKKGHLNSVIAQTEQAILESQLALENLKHRNAQDTANALKQVQADLASSKETLKENDERLKRTIIYAPEEGRIANLNPNMTPHSFISPQQVMMEIIPQDDNLVVEAKIPAIDIASVKLGQVSRVRLTAYRARVVPVLEGKVISIAADATQLDQSDMQMGLRQAYYKVRIQIDKDNLAKVAAKKDVALYPGMGVDVMVVTGSRTLMSYIMDPITLTLDHAFKER